MRQEVKELNSLIEQISQKTVDRTIGERYLISRMAVIVNEFDPITNSASIIIPTDLSHPTTYKYPNRTGKNKLANTVWENGEIKIYGDKVYLIYQTNNISQGWLEDNSPLSQGSMNYEDLTNKPSINGVQLSGNKTTEDLNIHIPTKVSDLDNDSGYLTESNLKTVNNNSLVGSGDISINKTTIGLGNVNNTSDLDKPISTATQTALDAKQDTLVSGVNIKTVNNQSLLGSGNIEAGAKFIKGTPINLYDTDGTTILNSENPQNILFYVNDSLITFDGTIISEIYSTNEVKTNEVWIDGKPIYRKTIYVSSLPNATATDFNHSISNVSSIWVDVSDSFIKFGDGSTSPFNYIGGNNSNLNASIELRGITTTKFTIDTHTTNRSSASAFITLRYTKTTD